MFRICILDVFPLQVKETKCISLSKRRDFVCFVLFFYVAVKGSVPILDLVVVEYNDL